MLTALTLLAGLVLAADNHQADNAVLGQLLEPGLAIDGGEHLPLPPPTLTDGATPEQQRIALERLIEGRYSFDQFTRSSVVAPHVLQVREQALGQGMDRLWHIDFWAVAYGELDTVADATFLNRLAGAAEGDVAEQPADDVKAEGQAVPPELLASMNIEPPADERETFSLVETNVLNRLALALVLHSAWTRSDDSVVAASIVDSRFASDERWSSRWWPLERTPAGEVTPGEPQAYGGSGGYLKITRLAEPAGALLIEGHWIYREPHDWFDGANLLVSKLPLVVQNQVRTARRELLLAK